VITVEQVEDIVESSRPRGGLFRGPMLVLLGLSMLLGALWANPALLGLPPAMQFVVPQVVLAVLVVLIIRGAMQQRRQAKLMLEGLEAVQLKDWRAAREKLLRLLRAQIRHRQARAASLLALAAVAEADHAYDACQRIYERVLTENAGDPLQLHTARVALAAAMLRTGQTTDAVTLIDRLERAADQGGAGLPGVLRAQIELLMLFREVTMGQSASAVARAEERRQLFREHLSTRAGYGYALLAVAFDTAGRPDAARQYWHDATLLVPEAELLERFEELAAMKGKYPEAERTL
jgi:tetratricopeptide (TPR) repeat protein